MEMVADPSDASPRLRLIRGPGLTSASARRLPRNQRLLLPLRSTCVVCIARLSPRDTVRPCCSCSKIPSRREWR